MFFNFGINSFVIEIAIDVNKAEQLAVGIPRLELVNNKILDDIVDPDLNKNSVLNQNIFFLNSSTSSYNIHYEFLRFQYFFRVVFFCFFNCLTSSSLVVYFNKVGSSFFNFGHTIY